MFKFEELHVYEESIHFVDTVYDVTKKWPSDERFSLTDQFRRAAISVTLNIAEGSSRTRKDFCHFLDLFRGSCYECVAILQIALKRGYINKSQHDQLYELLDKISRMTSALKNSLRQTMNE